MVLILLLALAYLVMWILTLINQLKRKEYAWFVITLLFQFVWIIYGIYRLVKK